MEKKMNARMQELLAAIHNRFIEEVGPVGDILIADVMTAMEKKLWNNPSTLRHYTKELAENIDNEVLRTRFLDDVGGLLLASESSISL
ncbi:MAG: hypothetical protein IPK77_05475 [Cellvibrio sp.]|jgi:hypothetical protein|nr:hypothetical protein [Cellvibrio sp.]